MPGIFVLRDGKRLQCLKKFEYTDFRQRLGRQDSRADGAGQFSRLLRAVQRRAVGHFQHVRHMAGRAGVQNGDPRPAVLQHIQYAGGQIARIQRAGFSRLQIDQHIPPLLRPADAPFQTGNIISGPGDVVSAAEIEPFHAAPPQEGDLLLFGDMAIYTMCKNNTFNGMPLPGIFVLRDGKRLQCLKKFEYTDFWLPRPGW